MSFAEALAGGTDLENNISEAQNLINYVNGDDVDVTMGSNGNLTNRRCVNEDQLNDQQTTWNCSGTFIKNVKQRWKTILNKILFWRKTRSNEETRGSFQFPDRATCRDDGYGPRYEEEIN